VLISWNSIHERVKSSSSCLLVLNRDDRRIRCPGSVPFLLLLGSDADSMALLIGMYGHGRKIYAPSNSL